MIVMNLELDNLFGFEEFDINFTYPKKIINSSIENEHLEGKPNFRYKKVNIIMGANASGKTSIGRALMAIFNFISKKNCNYLIPCIKNKNKSAKFLVDFVSDTNTDIMYRVVGVIYPENKVDVIVYTAKISKSDSYEKVVQKLIEIPVSEGELKNIESEDGNYLYRLNLPFNLSWLFSFTNDNSEKILEKDDGILNIKILQAVLKTLDKSITKVEKLKKENDNSETNMYSITLNSENIIIQNGKILNKDILSSGTAMGVDISYLISSIFENKHKLYFSDEKFSYIQSDVEIGILSLMISLLKPNTQLFFTTHNLDILEMGLPNHSFTFLKKDKQIKAVYPTTIIKKNDVSLRNAVKNDIFRIAPDIELIFDLEDILNDSVKEI